MINIEDDDINKKSKIKINSNKYIKIKLEKEIIHNILKNNGKIEINLTSKQNSLETTYTFKNETKNNYFYHCTKRPRCKGRLKFNKSDLNVYIINPCKNPEIHAELSYEKFCDLIKINKCNLIDFKIKKNQVNLFEFLLIQHSNYDKGNIIDEFRKYTKNEILLNNKEISRIKCKILGKLKNISMIECIEKIKCTDFELEIMAEDIKYNIKINNKMIERNEKIIIFGNKQRLELMNNSDYFEYFCDITFKIIPKQYRPYKLLTIATLDNKKNKTILIGFVLFKYKDYKSFIKIFEYLNGNYNFDPLILHSDYENGINLALKKAKFFKNKIIHIKCFFHFIKSIREKLKNISNNKIYLNRDYYVILKNIELLCFINESKFEGYKKLILDKLKSLNIDISFIEYLNSYWFRKDIKEFNYSSFIEKYKENDKALQKLYITNNIIESLNSKINSYALTSNPNKINFINSMKNIIINDTIKLSEYKRYDFITKSLLLLIEKENLNNSFKWFSYDIFKKYLKLILDENKEIDNIDNYIKIVEMEYNNNIDKMNEKTNYGLNITINNSINNLNESNIIKII